MPLRVVIGVIQTVPSGSTPTVAWARPTLMCSRKSPAYEPSRPSCTDSPGSSFTIPLSQRSSSRGGIKVSGHSRHRVLPALGDGAWQLQQVAVLHARPEPGGAGAGGAGAGGAGRGSFPGDGGAVAGR